MGSSLPPPPKFGSGQLTQPTNNDNWLTFTRWLRNLWSVASGATNVPQSISLNVAPSPGVNAEEVLGSSLAFAGLKAPLVPFVGADPAAIQALQERRDTLMRQGIDPAELSGLTTVDRGHRPHDDLNALLQMALSKTQLSTIYDTVSNPVIFEDTHANRVANFPAASYAPGTLFYETDRQILYIISAANIWVYCTGIMEAATGSRPTLGTADAGFVFIDTTLNIIEYWTGSAWVTAGGITQLTGDVTAGPGSGSQAATLAKIQGKTVTAPSPGTNDVLTYNGSVWVPAAAPGITELTGDVTAGPGSGSQASTLAAIQGNPVSAGSPSTGDVLTFNGTDWVPTAPAGSSGIALLANDTSQLTLLSTYQDIPGLSISLTKAGLWKITGIIGFDPTLAGLACFMQCVTGGIPQTPTAPPVFQPSNNLMTAGQWLFAGVIGSVVKLQAKSNAGGGFTDSTLTGSILAEFIHP